MNIYLLQIQSFFSNSSESVILGELGPGSSRFLGPARGVLPISPNGIRDLGTLPPSMRSDALLSYNYTFDHQGLISNISCIYDTQSPITFLAVPNDTFSMWVNASCNEIGLDDIVTTYYPVSNTDRTLTLWACKSIPTGEQYPAYHIYFRGSGRFYETDIGNITCTVSQIQPAVFPVTYQSRTGIFSTQKQITATAPMNSFSNLIEYAILSFQNVLQQAQTVTVNLVVASVQNLGVQGGIPLVSQNKQYLRLYEAMIQGILVDQVCTASNSSPPLLMVVPQVTYMRFLYSMMVNPPASCMRTMNGTFSAEVTGWVAKPVHIAFLIPMTIINLSSLIIVLISIAKAKRGRCKFDPIDPRPLLLAEPSLNQRDDSGWSDSVLYRSRQVRGYHILLRC